MSSSSSTPASELPAPTALPADEKEITILLQGREPVLARSYGVRARQPAGSATPLVLHFHGGNFVCGDLDHGRNVARMLMDAGATVVSMAYPLAPLHPFPDAIEVGYEALAWLYKHRAKFAGKGARVFLAGEEAGGNLAAALALIARDRAHPPLAGQILVSPMLDPCAGTASLRKAMGDSAGCKYSEGWQQYLSCARDAEHPYAVPGSATRLANIAPTLVLTGQDDPMRDEALKYAKRLADAGIDTRSCVVDAARNWPDALAEPPTQCPCSQAVTAEFRNFFEASEAQRAPSAEAPQPPH